MLFILFNANTIEQISTTQTMWDIRKWHRILVSGIVAQLVERLICIQEAWGSTPHNSKFFNKIISLFKTLLIVFY